jgi:ZipA, C-terminal FtsZ-binding domain
MSTLLVSLIALVVATLAGVVGLNLLQTRRARAAGRVSGVEPGEPQAGAPVAPPAPEGRIEPSLGSAGPAVLADTGKSALSGSATPVASRAAYLSELCDCIVEMRLNSPQSGDRLIALTQSLRRVGAKPVIVEGSPVVFDQSTDRSSEPRLDATQWVALAPGRPFAAIRAGVLLANRHGPLNAMEFSEFVAALNGLADQLGMLPDLPDMVSVLERARALDASCIKLDAQIGVNVDSSEPLSPVDLEWVARDQRLTERGNNRYARLGEHGEMLFSVALADSPNRLTFLLDVPRAPAAQSPWQALVQCAHACTNRLQGTLVDDGGRTLGQPALDRIGAELERRYAVLENAGLVAGSPLALRLFN